jgi:chaperonin cofactor prefoldin
LDFIDSLINTTVYQVGSPSIDTKKKSKITLEELEGRTNNLLYEINRIKEKERFLEEKIRKMETDILIIYTLLILLSYSFITH